MTFRIGQCTLIVFSSPSSQHSGPIAGRLGPYCASTHMTDENPLEHHLHPGSLWRPHRQHDVDRRFHLVHDVQDPPYEIRCLFFTPIRYLVKAEDFLDLIAHKQQVAAGADLWISD